MTQLLSSGEFCKLRYDTIPVKSASANVSISNNSKIPNFELWHSFRKWANIERNTRIVDYSQGWFSFQDSPPPFGGGRSVSACTERTCDPGWFPNHSLGTNLNRSKILPTISGHFPRPSSHHVAEVGMKTFLMRVCSCFPSYIGISEVSFIVLSL